MGKGSRTPRARQIVADAHPFAVAYLARLAYPGNGEAEQRRELRDALLAWRARELYEAGYMKRHDIPVGLERANWPPDRIYARGKNLMGVKRILKRFDAVKMADMRLSGDACTIKDAARQVRPDMSNALHFVWAESKPALHLAAALNEYLLLAARYLFPEGAKLPPPLKPGDIDWVQLLANPFWVRPTLDAAERIRQRLLQQPALELEPSDLIAVTWATLAADSR